MLVLFAIMLMSISVMGVVEYLGYCNQESAVADREFRAMHLAECGITLGLHPTILPGDPVLKQDIGSDSGFDVTISSEGARIPVNNLTDDTFRQATYNLFVQWGLTPDQANIAVDSLSDWIDTDGTPRSQGAENDYYTGQGFPDFPKNQPFSSLEEMLLVRGMDAVERAKPDWRNYFSIYGDGLIDLNNAPKDIIQAFFGVADTVADNLVKTRYGPDGIPGTADDVTLTLTSAQSLLGLETAAFQALSSYLTVQHLTRRVESVGRVGTSRFRVIVVARIQTDGSMNFMARIEE